ncbi:class I SAM-dependent methyltransferase [Paenibacillus sp. CAU 1782]
MLESLEAIQRYRINGLSSGDEANYPWLRYLISAEERIVNVERIQSLRELAEGNHVLDYVERTLALLNQLPLSFWIKELLEEVLIWCETSKGGTLRERILWQQEGINCRVHNIGSAQLYRKINGAGSPRAKIVAALIEGHGLVGQQIRGEVPASEGLLLSRLAQTGMLTPGELAHVLDNLAYCVIGAVSAELWEQTKPEAHAIIATIARHGCGVPDDLRDRFKRMRLATISKGENFDALFDKLELEEGLGRKLAPLENKTFWYAEPALQHFSLGHFLKIMTLIAAEPGLANIRHISLEQTMASMYYDYRGVKKINVYKLRMIEHYLNGEDAKISGSVSAPQLEAEGRHLDLKLERQDGAPDTLFIRFVFSPAAEKLIEFCMEAEKSPLYEQAVLMLFDLFGLRRDAYDRFHNEETYLSDMNSSVDYKRVLLNYVTGRKVVDIGPGGGVLLDLLEDELPHVEPLGIDIAANVVEALARKKQLEGRCWEVRQGDALKLDELLGEGGADTVIFSSILHELYSYIPYEGSKFNLRTVEAALQSAFRTLAPGGRILIRDGVMSEPDSVRKIVFLHEDGMSWLERYSRDFKGRAIQYSKIAPNEAVMPVNDAMEFLYTYTWGEEAYVHEVQEQFGYLTLSQYKALVHDLFGGEAVILESRAYLQEGYTEALQDKVRLYDGDGNETPLPHSTCLLIIEKRQ